MFLSSEVVCDQTGGWDTDVARCGSVERDIAAERRRTVAAAAAAAAGSAWSGHVQRLCTDAAACTGAAART